MVLISNLRNLQQGGYLIIGTWRSRRLVGTHYSEEPLFLLYFDLKQGIVDDIYKAG
jgi:hypothetical protein